MQNLLNIPENIKEAILSFLAGNSNDNQTERLLLWVNSNPQNKKLFNDVTEIWHAATILNTEKNKEVHLAWDDVLTRISDKPNVNAAKSYTFSPFYKVAASIALFIAAGSGWLFHYSGNALAENKNQFIEMSAPMGSRTFLKLTDGTQVWLNSGSYLKVPTTFGNKTRDVSLTGEAYFSVAKNKMKPFVVHTSDVNITALGTTFNVKAYNDEQNIETTLEEGSVKIESTGSNHKNQKPLLLKPKQKAVYQRNNSELFVSSTKKPTPACDAKTEKPESKITPLKILQVEDLRPVISWKDERWFIKQETFGEMVRKLERRYDITVILEDPEIKEFSFTGSLQNESIEQVLNIIQFTAPIDYTVKHKLVTLRINKKLKSRYKDLLQQQITQK